MPVTWLWHVDRYEWLIKVFNMLRRSHLKVKLCTITHLWLAKYVCVWCDIWIWSHAPNTSMNSTLSWLTLIFQPQTWADPVFTAGLEHYLLWFSKQLQSYRSKNTSSTWNILWSGLPSVWPEEPEDQRAMAAVLSLLGVLLLMQGCSLSLGETGCKLWKPKGDDVCCEACHAGKKRKSYGITPSGKLSNAVISSWADAAGWYDDHSHPDSLIKLKLCVFFMCWK